MRRIALLSLLALAPIAAVANDISFQEGKFVSGTINRTASGALPTFFNLDLVGTRDRIEITGIPADGSGFAYGFSGATVTVLNSSGVVVFQDTIADGTAFVAGTPGPFRLTIKAELSPVQGYPTQFLSLVIDGPPVPATTVTNGNFIVGSSIVPEPETLGLIGIGIVSLAGLRRRMGL
jgi:hypothetical protein